MMEYGKKLFVFIGVVLTVISSASQVWANQLEQLRVWPSPDDTRVVLDLDNKAKYSYFTLSNPDRLVVDLKETKVKKSIQQVVKGSDVLRRVRKSTPPEKSSYRLVFELKSQVKPKLFTLAPSKSGGYGHRLVIDLPHSLIKKSSSPQVSKSAPSRSVRKEASQLSGQKDIIVAIDAGHGGVDPGSIGPSKKYEKHTTLTVAKKLAQQINAIDGMQAVLTRRGDYYVDLNRRSEIARRNKAHLLVSIHADAFRSPRPRGASVFVLNIRRASTELSRLVENQEKQSQLLGGAGLLLKDSKDKNVSQTVLDLQFNFSQKEGYRVASKILHEMGKVATLHKKKPVHASLAVLKSPDIPSVLVETGFISNPKEEQLLFNSRHQNKLANALKVAIVDYFEEQPPAGTLFAYRKQKTIKHTVKRGESLSVIAQQYKTSISLLKSNNKLSSNVVHLGQTLIISSPKVIKRQATVAVPQEKRTTHIVRSGDYLGKIANRYNVTISEIKRWNNLKSNTLRKGQSLAIYTLHKVSTKPKKHKVKSGEFLSKIAANYRVPVDKLKKINKLRSDKLLIGQVLIIPN
ncbi:N-acetylmuramoyl-L-alanine amidase [Vibrio sp.]|nr:N-acetylmuramoyl-L-alanine amidase [Vibrio sp.]